ncbi:MAG TPA: glycine zipper 2TM domain-containing protein [Noviherbaspirillum sp.]|uniref:glycine zipper 2TM domain-containing protein n=1 Tax=Noviherbaspirillum sp. TaxID=1926288 RepID=UPI002D575C76|nr:glycine zipper 2TM domain-containing protein [Noviherbaspirillum sp.]HYD94879.1 glycine zipper 2TM domain-containing protein [Noviherbaspirillum sp.]
MWTDKTKLSVIGISVILLTACGTPQRTTSSAGSVPVTTTTSTIPTTTSTTSSASGYGVVQAIDVIPREQAAGLGLGTVAGAVVGGVLGNQVGSGTGRKAATVAGAAGGAIVGHQMEKGAGTSGQVYRVAVRMDNGAVQTLAQEAAPGVQVGDRVRLENGVIVERFR